MQEDVVSVERVIPAPPEAIFELVADASKHHLIDGSGTVKGARQSGSQRLRLGDVFGMSMKMGFPYATKNTVVELEENRRIAWQTGLSGPLGRLIGGRTWRYELEPVEGGTRVRESWDLSTDHMGSLLKRTPLVRQTKENMERTLERIADVVASDVVPPSPS